MDHSDYHMTRSLATRVTIAFEIDFLDLYVGDINVNYFSVLREQMSDC